MQGLYSGRTGSLSPERGQEGKRIYVKGNMSSCTRFNERLRRLMGLSRGQGGPSKSNDFHGSPTVGTLKDRSWPE